MSTDVPLNFSLYDLHALFFLLLSFSDGFGEYRDSWWSKGAAASWNLNRPPYFIPSPATAVNWNSRLPGEFSWRTRLFCVRDTTWRKLIRGDDYIGYLGEQVSLWQRRDGSTRYSTLPQKLLKRFYEHSCPVSCRSSYKSRKLCTCTTQATTSVDHSTRHRHYGHVSLSRLITWGTFCVRKDYKLNLQYNYA